MTPARPASNLFFRLPSAIRANTCFQCRRQLHSSVPTPAVPKPTPFVPDVRTFLTLIGRNLSQHAGKIPSWEALFTLSGQQLRESGVEPARARRYLLWWRERFRNGIQGIGGDLTNVRDGVAELRLIEVPSTRKIDQLATVNKGANMRKIIVNSPPSLLDATEAEEGSVGEGDATPAKSPATVLRPANLDDSTAVSGVKVVNNSTIGGRGVIFIKGYQDVALLKVQEGLWENRRGHKVDGGERRKAEVRAKRRVQERKNAR